MVSDDVNLWHPYSEGLLEEDAPPPSGALPTGASSGELVQVAMHPSSVLARVSECGASLVAFHER